LSQHEADSYEGGTDRDNPFLAVFPWSVYWTQLNEDGQLKDVVMGASFVAFEDGDGEVAVGVSPRKDDADARGSSSSMTRVPDDV
jgi:hypothetical protein